MTEMGLIDWGIIIGIFLFAAAIFYRALQELFDMIFSWFRGIFSAIGSGSQKTVEVISYE